MEQQQNPPSADKGKHKDPNINSASGEKRLKLVVTQCREAFKFVQDHCATFEQRSRGLLDAPILNLIKYADPDSTKAKQVRTISNKTEQLLNIAIANINTVVSSLLCKAGKETRQGTRLA